MAAPWPGFRIPVGSSRLAPETRPLLLAQIQQPGGGDSRLLSRLTRGATTGRPVLLNSPEASTS